MNKKIITVSLLVVLIAICITGLAACKDNNSENKYTVTWKNDNGDVLKADENVKEGSIPAYDGATPTKKGTAETRYVFNGWQPSLSEVKSDVTYTAKYTVKNKEDLVAGVDVVFSDDLKTAQYGFYPQTRVSDEAVIAELNALTPSETNGWYLYGGNYYAKQTATVYNNESYVFGDGAAIVNGTEYWFKCEPIVWQVLGETDGTYYLLSDKLLDAHNFYADYSNRNIGGATVYANNYVQSGIRAWLNGAFYDTAFALGNADIAVATVDNGGATTDVAENAYACANTQDKVYLPSYKDYLNSSYGFDTNAAETSATRECKTTDYVRATGAWCNKEMGYNGSYWTRSPSSEYNYCAWNVNSAGLLSAYAVDGSSHSVRPCISVSF